MSGQTTFLRLFSFYAALDCALLACGDPKSLSVGEVRCEGVSCAPIETVSIETELVTVADVERDDELVPMIGEMFCNDPSLLSEAAGDGGVTDSLSPLGGEPGESDPTCLMETMVPLGGEQILVATALVTASEPDRIEWGLRLARYAGVELQGESTELSRELALVPGYLGDSVAIAASAVRGEAIVGRTRETGDYSAYGQEIYVLKTDGELVALFEDESAGRIRGIAALGEDIIVASEYDLRFELTRYTMQGVIVWRQTTLTLGEDAPEGYATTIGSSMLRMIDGERIVVMVPRKYSYQLLELTAEGELVRSWLNAGVYGDEGQLFVGAQLAAGQPGEFVVGLDGYDISRASFASGEPRIERFTKERTQFYTPNVLGLHVDQAGYVYIATIDGIRDNGFGLVERISPDLSRRERFVIADTTPKGYPFVIGGELLVSEDQRTLYFARGGAIGTLELPPLPE